MASRTLRAAIIGGGIGGLAAAIALLRRGVDVTVYEQASELGEVGAGVFIFPNSLRLLERAGLGRALANVGGRVGPGSEIYRMDGTIVGPFLTEDSSGWNGMYGMHRADLLRVLAEALPPGTVHTAHRCTGFEQDGEAAHLVFANDARAAFDLVVAADGIHSTLQTFVIEPSPPVYSGVRAYRGLLPRSALPDWRHEAHQTWMGDGKHFLVFPVRSGQLLNYVGFVPTADQTAESWSAPGDRDELAASFDGWDPRVTGLLAKVESCFWWGLYDRHPLARWTLGRLVLLGDAAHPMLPHLGQGANQSIEDGFALAAMLEGRDSTDVEGVLRRYQAFRQPRTDIVQAEARKNGLRYDSRYADLAVRDLEVKRSPALRRWMFDYDVEREAFSLDAR